MSLTLALALGVTLCACDASTVPPPPCVAPLTVTPASAPSHGFSGERHVSQWLVTSSCITRDGVLAQPVTGLVARAVDPLGVALPTTVELDGGTATVTFTPAAAGLHDLFLRPEPNGATAQSQLTVFEDHRLAVSTRFRELSVCTRTAWRKDQLLCASSSGLHQSFTDGGRQTHALAEVRDLAVRGTTLWTFEPPNVALWEWSGATLSRLAAIDTRCGFTGRLLDISESSIAVYCDSVLKRVSRDGGALMLQAPFIDVGVSQAPAWADAEHFVSLQNDEVCVQVLGTGYDAGARCHLPGTGPFTALAASQGGLWVSEGPTHTLSVVRHLRAGPGGTLLERSLELHPELRPERLQSQPGGPGVGSVEFNAAARLVDGGIALEAWPRFAPLQEVDEGFVRLSDGNGEHHLLERPR